MSNEFDPEKARQLTFEALRTTVVFMHQNKDMILKMIREDLGAPDDEMAEGFHAQCIMLLHEVAQSVAASPPEKVLDARNHPGVERKEMH